MRATGLASMRLAVAVVWAVVGYMKFVTGGTDPRIYVSAAVIETAIAFLLILARTSGIGLIASCIWSIALVVLNSAPPRWVPTAVRDCKCLGEFALESSGRQFVAATLLLATVSVMMHASTATRKVGDSR